MDEGNIFSTLSRLARVGSAAGGLATRVVGEKFFGREIKDDIYAKELKNTLGRLRGPLMKVAQFLATIPEAIPPEYAQEFLELQSNAPPMGEGFVKRRMSFELGPDWQTKFDSFEIKASAAASLGQVHKAILPNGKAVACKLQYPQMEKILEADLSNLRAFLGVYHAFNKALDTSEVQKEISERLHEELDYIQENQNILLYQNLFKDSSFVKIPQTYPEYSTSRLLTMEWMNGRNLLSYQGDNEETRNQLARHLFYAWYEPFYGQGVIHGDPHPGNYLVNEDLSLNLLDFGCVRKFPPPFIQGVVMLYRALLEYNLEKTVEAYEAWGFKGLTKAHIEVMNNWAKLLYEPLLEDKVRPIQRQYSGAEGWEVATKVHRELHKLGGIKPPREFVFMDRASVGLGAVFMRLRANLNWHRMTEEMIESHPW